MTKKFKQLLSNQKGFTLIEILVVISIIAILFVTLLPQIDFAGDKARQTGVKTDFHTFQVANESYMRETAAKALDSGELNSYLDKGMKIDKTGGAANAGLSSEAEDPWGKQYKVSIYKADKTIVINSFGKDGVDDNGTNDDFVLATYYVDGVVGSCTKGFQTNNVTSEVVTVDCGLKNPSGAFGPYENQ